MITALLLFLFHVMTISFITSSTRRFSVEFIPITLVFCVYGLARLEKYFERFRRKGHILFVILFIIFASSFYQGIIFKDSGRILNKEAGLFMKTFDPGKKIASRIPLVPFYSKGEWVNIVEEIKIAKDFNGLMETLKKMGVHYIVVDEVLIKYAKEKNIDIDVNGCAIEMSCIACFENRDEFVRILRL